MQCVFFIQDLFVYNAFIMLPMHVDSMWNGCFEAGCFKQLVVQVHLASRAMKLQPHSLLERSAR